MFWHCRTKYVYKTQTRDCGCTWCISERLHAYMPDDTRVKMRVSAFLTEVVVQLDPSCSEARSGIGQGVVRANEISSVMVSADV